MLICNYYLLVIYKLVIVSDSEKWKTWSLSPVHARIW